MRHAPPVLVLVGRSRFGVAAMALACLAGLVLLLAWAWAVPASQALQGLMATLLVACGTLAWRSARRTPTGQLDWDGASWCWETAQSVHEVRLSVACDLQHWLLVCMLPRDGSGTQWLWLAHTGDDGHWRSVRRALYFRGASQAPPEQPAAMP